jgi:anti-anti-sigma factor
MTALPRSRSDNLPAADPAEAVAPLLLGRSRTGPSAAPAPLPDEPRISVETARCDRLRALVKVTGELDLRTAAPLWAVLQGHVNSGRRFVRLDVSGVTFLDATALTGITAVHRELLHRRGTLVITGVRSLVARVLRVTGLDTVLFVSGPRADDDLPVPFSTLDPPRASSA